MKTKKILNGVLSASLLITGALGTVPVYAAGGSAEISIADDSISIGNDYLQRNYSIEDGRILTSSIDNKRIDMETVPGTGSEDFVINTISEGSVETEDPIVNDPIYEYTEPLSTEGWTATLKNKDNTEYPAAQVALLFDGNTDTYIDYYQISGHPITLDINFGSEQTIAGMSVNKRPGFSSSSYGINGTMGGYEIWTSADGTEYTKLTEGEFTQDDYNLHKEGDLYNVGDMVYVNFDSAVTTQYVRVVQTSVALGTAQEFTSAEVDFYDKPVEKTQVVKAPEQVLEREGWDVTIKNSSGQVFSDEHTARLTDGNLNTNPDEYTKSGNPFTVDIDLGSEQTVSSISIDKRPGYSDKNYGINGTMGEFELYVSDNGSTWKLAGAGNFTAEAYNLHQEGSLYNVGDRVYANFYQTYTTRYVRLVQKSCSMGSTAEFTSAELNLYSDPYYGPDWNTQITPVNEDAIYSSSLTFEKAQKENTEDGVKLTISYEPFELNGVTYDIDQVVVMNDDDHYMRSFLEISVDDKEKAKIDYIDTDRFVLPSDAQGVWCHPDDSKISSMWIGQHELMLGQPIYVNGLFMGSEFPAADTIINDNATQVRYYSGKNFAKLKEDGQLTTDGKFVSWQNVIGAAQGTDTEVVQTDFFSYIEDIATPTEFRKQYNSWYDNMMSITDESIAASFNGAEAGLAQNGVEPLDSYVVDDGWNNYYSVIGDTTYVSPNKDAGSGTPNQTGFWEFNNKFPNELYTSTALADKFDATFGVWVGPQGGYNYFGGFSGYIEAAGTGYQQHNSALGNVVCTGSRKYIKNFQTMAIDYQDRFNVEYWKWDGFASRPCNAEDHDHMTGGDNNMYFTSDLWEAWIDLFEAVRENNPDIFINATCYVNLSPWLLQWVNTVWVQDSGDTGQLGTGERHEQKIYYRDQVYYQLYKQNQIQFPLKNIYNHDPIYGVSDGSSATTEVFREFLFANAVRGTAFWELYYSPSIMDDAKWKVTADALEWAEENHEILKNAKLFGNQPRAGVYGYSSWNGEQGIISFTNPLDSEQTYTLTVDDTAGAVPTLKDAVGIQVEPYVNGVLDTTLSYGDELTVTLAPHETKIFQFNGQEDTAPAVVSAEMKDNNTVQVKFSERVNSDAAFTINGEAAASAVLMDDYRTVELTSEESLAGGKVTVGVDGLTDTYGNEYKDGDISFTAYDNNVVADLSGVESTGIDGTTGKSVYKLDGETVTLSEDGVEGTGVFSAAFSIKTESSDAVILKQGDAFTVKIDADGYLEAKIGSKSFNSKEEVTTVIEKAHGTFGTDEYVPTTFETATTGKINDGETHTVVIVREANGMLKIYIDGVIASSLYDTESLNEDLESASVVLGSKALTATLSDLKVVKEAIDYSEAAELQSSITPESRTELDRSEWTASACSEMTMATGDSYASAAIDGNLNTWWHTNYVGGDTCSGSGTNHWIAIDFGKEETFDSIDYTGRGGSNGDVSKYNLYVKDENGEWQLLISQGEFNPSNAVNSITFDEPVTTSGIKFELLQTVGGFGAAKEIQAYISNLPADAADVKAAYTAAKEVFDTVDSKDYTEDSYQAYADAYADLKALNDLAEDGETVMQFVLDDVVKAVNDAYGALVEDSDKPEPQPVSKKTLEYFLNQAKGYVEDGTVSGLVESIQQMFADAIEKGEAVMADEDATREEVLDAAKDLMLAIHALNMKAADKTDLEMALELTELIDLSKYVEAGQAEYLAAKEAAEAVMADGDAMQAETDEAWSRLVEAMNALRLKADKSVLQDLISQMEGLDLSAYTEESVTMFRAALASANSILTDAALSVDDQAKVDEAVKTLQAAYDSLEKTQSGEPENPGGDTDDPQNPGGSDTDDPQNPDGDSQSGNGGQNGSQSTGSTQTGVKGSAVKTGDSQNIVFPIAGLAAAAVVIAGIGNIVYRRKKK